MRILALALILSAVGCGPYSSQFKSAATFAFELMQQPDASKADIAKAMASAHSAAATKNDEMALFVLTEYQVAVGDRDTKMVEACRKAAFEVIANGPRDNADKQCRDLRSEEIDKIVKDAAIQH